MIAEGFAHTQSTVLGIQLRPIANVTDLAVNDIQFIHTNLGPQRLGDILITVDGNSYNLRFIFTEEAIDNRTVQGHVKRKNPKVKER